MALGPSVLVGRGFTDAFVALLDTPFPILAAARSDQDLIVSWYAKPSEWVLESAGTVPGGPWTPHNEPVTAEGRRHEVRPPGHWPGPVLPTPSRR